MPDERGAARNGLRVLHVAQPTDGGVAACVVDFTRLQQEDGLDVHVACPDGPGDLADRLRSAGVPVHRWQAGRSPGPGVLHEAVRLARLLAQVEPDVVHLHSAKAGLVGRMVVRGRLPTLFQPHAWSFDAVTGPVRALTVGWERAAVRWADVVVCVSSAERERGAGTGVHPARVDVVANGVDLARLQPRDRGTARVELGLPQDVPLALCVGRLTRQKGQDVLLDAWPAVRARVPDARLFLLGEGPDRPVLTARGLDGVHLLPPGADVATWMAAADLVVSPSRWEGMALVPLEAMAGGRSVVVSDVTGMSEAVPSGAGRRVPPEEPVELAAAVAERLDGTIDADAEGRLGRAHVERAHDVRAAARRLGALYAELSPRRA